jgi:hypothetical protein
MTTKLVFSELMQLHNRPFHPTVKELLRERMTNHTCDRRSSRSYIEENYPEYIIEPSLTEKDELWGKWGDEWEPIDEHCARKQKVLEDIFATDPNPFISLTIHDQAIKAILLVVGGKTFKIREGSTFALLVKAERLAEE